MRIETKHLSTVNYDLVYFSLFNGLNGVKIENKGKQSMLIFFNVSEEDYGNYTCVAMNTLGITNASIILYGKETFNKIILFIFIHCLVLFRQITTK